MLQTFNAVLKETSKLAENIHRFVFSFINQELEFEAGQYMLVEVGGGYRQYSIGSSPNQKKETETVVDVTPMGLGSKYLLNLKVGDEVKFRAPMGVFKLQKTSKPKFFLGTGTGIVPLKSMILALTESDFASSYNLYWGLRTKGDLYFQDIWQALKAKNMHFAYHYCLSQEKDAEENVFIGHIQEGILATQPNPEVLQDAEFYLCGRPETVARLQEFLLNELHIPNTQIFHEKFS